jgi:type II secretory pathway pseudopilin PulG
MEPEKFQSKKYTTAILLGIIAVLIICIIVLLSFMISRRKAENQEAAKDLDQAITEYAQEQKQQELDMGEQTVDGAFSADKEDENTDSQLTADDSDKTAIVVDVEDESDVSYTKEYILNEALPYFADNNQDAIWDLAHLKRYVKLSKELEGTNSYYYQGDVDADGEPDGEGFAIYEQNSYYYGEWSHGVRSGQGTWFRFYIGTADKNNAMGKYTAHSYAGEWANDLPNGQGAEHFEVDIDKLSAYERILQNVVGNFTGGLYDGELYANTVDYTGNVEEWDGIAQKGTFELWRDMSAIGECSVWRKKDDTSVCMDIDKSENKNQGITELLN